MALILTLIVKDRYEIRLQDGRPAAKAQVAAGPFQVKPTPGPWFQVVFGDLGLRVLTLGFRASGLGFVRV